MFRSKIDCVVVLLFIIEASIAAVVQADPTDIEPLGSSEDNGSFEKYENVEPLSVLRKSEVREMIINKTYELKMYSKIQDSNEEVDKESLSKGPLIGKLFIYESTKILENGKQVGPVDFKNSTIFMNGDSLPKELEQIPEVKPETVDTAPNPGSETDSESSQPSETDSESSQPSAVDSPKAETSEDVPEKNTTGPKNVTDTIMDIVTSALTSSAVGVHGLLFNNILLMLPVFIGQRFI